MLRSAIFEILLEMEDMSGFEVGRKYKFSPDALAQQCRDALAAPVRNCDVGTAKEQTEKFNQFCQSHRNSDLPKCAGCPLEDIPDGTGCAQAWAQMPYEEGGAK